MILSGLAAQLPCASAITVGVVLGCHWKLDWIHIKVSIKDGFFFFGSPSVVDVFIKPSQLPPALLCS